MFEVAIWKSLHSRLRNFSLDVSFRSSCKRIVLYGPSGSGKSLTLKAIAGLMKPDSGLIRLAGRTLFDSRNRIDIAPQERRLGYVFQNYALFPHLTVRQNIAFGRQRSSPANWFNPRHNRPDKKVDYWLQAFHLESVAGQYPEQLSGGQQQRTALARALLCEPQALLLDEPFSALDPDLRGMLRTELLELQTRLDLPMILITHDAEDVKAFAEETLRLEEGRCKSHRSNS